MGLVFAIICRGFRRGQDCWRDPSRKHGPRAGVVGSCSMVPLLQGWPRIDEHGSADVNPVPSEIIPPGMRRIIVCETPCVRTIDGPHHRSHWAPLFPSPFPSPSATFGDDDLPFAPEFGRRGFAWVGTSRRASFRVIDSMKRVVQVTHAFLCLYSIFFGIADVMLPARPRLLRANLR